MHPDPCFFCAFRYARRYLPKSNPPALSWPLARGRQRRRPADGPHHHPQQRKFKPCRHRRPVGARHHHRLFPLRERQQRQVTARPPRIRQRARPPWCRAVNAKSRKRERERLPTRKLRPVRRKRRREGRSAMPSAKRTKRQG